MKTTRYFDEQVLREATIRSSNSMVRSRNICAGAARDNRTVEFGIGDRFSIPGRKSRMLRVVTLDDGETVHNAFFDRDFR